jgi:Na+-driven multidrug efflux pump
LTSNGTKASSVWLFSIVGVLLTLVMVVFHGQIAELMHTPAEAMADTKSYILVCSTGILFIIGYNVVCGILRGLGDSKTPLYFVGLACVINIVLDFILVGYGSRIGYNNSTGGQFCYFALVLARAWIPFRVYSERYPA